MASHNPLSAKLAAEAGFDAIWGSGFELSAAYAVPDASILSADTHLEVMRAIGEVQDAPVIADLDTGYGNAVNVAYLVPRYAAAGVAAVTIEDKTWGKGSSQRNSPSTSVNSRCSRTSSGAHSVQPVAMSVSTKVCTKLPFATGPLWLTRSASTNHGRRVIPAIKRAHWHAAPYRR
jgi:hypothetical protein